MLVLDTQNRNVDPIFFEVICRFLDDLRFNQSHVNGHVAIGGVVNFRLLQAVLRSKGRRRSI